MLSIRNSKLGLKQGFIVYILLDKLLNSLAHFTGQEKMNLLKCEDSTVSVITYSQVM